MWEGLSACTHQSAPYPEPAFGSPATCAHLEDLRPAVSNITKDDEPVVFLSPQPPHEPRAIYKQPPPPPFLLVVGLLLGCGAQRVCKADGHGEDEQEAVRCDEEPLARAIAGHPAGEANGHHDALLLGALGQLPVVVVVAARRGVVEDLRRAGTQRGPRLLVESAAASLPTS